MALFVPGLAGLTTLLWVINFLNLLTIFFVNSWLPSILGSMGVTAQGAILATSMFHVGAIAAAFLSAALVGRGIERVLTFMLLFGGVCIMVTGVATLSVQPQRIHPWFRIRHERIAAGHQRSPRCNDPRPTPRGCGVGY